jgi:hypothetical protein
MVALSDDFGAAAVQITKKMALLKRQGHLSVCQ